MRKIVDLKIIKANGFVCTCNEDKGGNNADEHFCKGYGGVGLPTARRGYMIPTHIIVGIFNDGSIRAAGIQRLNDLNEHGNDYNELFLYDNIEGLINEDFAKALVRDWKETGEYETLIECKNEIYKDLRDACVKISSGAERFFKNDEEP